jgi:hypothetical protein
MKTYTFEIFKNNLVDTIVLTDLLIGLIFLGITLAYAPTLAGPVFIVTLLIILIPRIFSKIFVSHEEVTIKDSGFYIKSQGRFVEWNELTWYKTGINNSPLVDILGFGVSNGKNASFSFYKKSQTENDWADFRKDIIHLVGVNCPELKNYYQRKGFQMYSKYVYVFWILVPIILVLLGGKGTSVFITTALVIGGTAPLLSAIKRNQKQRLN